MKAKLLFKEKHELENNLILELVLWELPIKTKERPHGYKYRLYFGNSSVCFVRYDNELGKGDHKHIGDKELPYKFVDKYKLIKDFYHDVMKFIESNRGNKQ